METTVKLLRYLIVVIIVALLGGAAGWFFFVRSHQSPAAKSGAVNAEEKAPLYPGSMAPSGADVAQNADGSSTSAGPKTIEQLWRADQGPVAGYSFITQKKNATSSIHLYFVERANGNVFDADAVEQTTTRLTNTLIPKTYEALIPPKGAPVVLRSIEGGSITTLLASFATPSSTTTFPQALAGPTLPEGIRTIALDPDPSTGLLFYLAPSSAGGVVGMVSSLANTRPQQIFSSPIGSWRAQFASGDIILLLSPADGVPGYAYALSAGGVQTLYAGPTPGLMVLPHPREETLLYSGSSGGRLSLYARVGKNAAVLLPVQTVAEKCVWAPDLSAQSAATNRSPVRAPDVSFVAYCAVPKSIPTTGFIDPWYKGSLHTSDTWWRIDAQNGTADEIFTPDSPLDVHDPHIDPTGSYIAFANGADMSLWMLRIVQ